MGYHSNWFSNRYHNWLATRWGVCNGYYHNNAFRFYYSGWFNFGFCGGYYYPVRPFWQMDMYYYYPMIYWLYVDITDGDVPYYETWYGPDYPSCPVDSFKYRRAFYPTDTMRDLGIDMSALPADAQCRFREAMVNMTDSLVAKVSGVINASFTLHEFDIVVNHYENLQNQGVTLAGYVDRDNIHVPFQAFLDLANPSATSVFVPTTQEPSSSQLNELEEQNDQVTNLGGNPNVIDIEPEHL